LTNSEISIGYLRLSIKKVKSNVWWLMASMLMSAKSKLFALL